MRLTAAQERLLLRKHLTGDFGGVKNYQSIVKLIEDGYLEEIGMNLVVTPKGRQYCDAHHMDISLHSDSQANRVKEAEALYNVNSFGRLGLNELPIVA